MADFFRSGRGNTRVCLETALQAGRLQFFSNARAREELGWKPQVPIEKSVAEAVAWFRPEPEPVTEPRRVGGIACSVSGRSDFGPGPGLPGG